MKKPSMFCLAGAVALLAVINGPAFSGDMAMPPPPSTPEFEIIKSLEGTWVGEGEMHGKKQAVEVRYRITSGKTAVEETLFPGTPHEMVSVYFVDGNDLKMTHYCALGNQPRMKLTEFKKHRRVKTLSMNMYDATGMKSPQDPHMGALKLTLKGDDQLTQEWILSSPKGKEASIFKFKKVN